MFCKEGQDRSAVGLNRRFFRAGRVGVVLVGLALGFGANLQATSESLERLPLRSVPFAGGSWPIGEARDYGFDGGALDRAIDRIGEQDGIYSVLVVRDSHLVAERYFREASRTKAHNLKSSSKSIISALVGLLVEEGKLSLNDSVVERLSVRGLSADRAAITVRDLLRMASGLTSTSYESYGAWIASSDWVKGALALPLLHPPGTEYRYSTGNTHMLSALVRQASGQSTRAFAEERLFAPLGIEVLGWETDPKGIHIGGNNLALLPRDMAKFGELYLRGGVWEGRQVIPRRWVAESTSRQIVADHEVYGDYGYQWFVPSAEEFRGDFIAVGYGGQYIYVAPQIETVVVVTSTLESKGRAWEKRLFSVIEGDLLQVEGVLMTSTNEQENSPSVPVEAAQPASTSESVPDQALATLRLEKANWLEERQKLHGVESDLRAGKQDLEQSLDAAKVTIDNLRRREELHLAEAEVDAERAALEAETALLARGELSVQLRASSKIITRQTEQLTSIGVELERSQAARQRLVQQAETDQRQAKVSGENARDELLQKFSLERRQLETELTTEQARADQALRQLEKARTLTQTADRKKALSAEQRQRTLERAVAAEQALARRGQRLSVLQEELEALRTENKGLRAQRVTDRVAGEDALSLLGASRREVEELGAQVARQTALEVARQTALEVAGQELARQTAFGTAQTASYVEAARELEQLLQASEGSRVELQEDLLKSRQEAEVRAASLERALASTRQELARRNKIAAENSNQTKARVAELVGLRETVEVAEAQLGDVEAELARLRVTGSDVAGEVDRLSFSLLESEAQLGSVRLEQVAKEKRWVTAQNTLQGRLQLTTRRVEELDLANRELVEDLSAARVAGQQAAALRAENEDSLAKAQETRDRERQELMRRLDERERSIQGLRRELTESQERVDLGLGAASLQKSYQQLLLESEMLARRSGEQAEKIAVLQRRVREGAGSDFERRIKELMVEVDRMLGDRRLSGVVRRDLARLRGALAELGKGK